mmetsp:Transcript_24813/g.44962  ORF Transcript_24813/g.44962 Transcript_24813/m.44962 type:complete len:276 (+) Transcript_24813:127-954(+)
MADVGHHQLVDAVIIITIDLDTLAHLTTGGEQLRFNNGLAQALDERLPLRTAEQRALRKGLPRWVVITELRLPCPQVGLDGVQALHHTANARQLLIRLAGMVNQRVVRVRPQPVPHPVRLHSPAHCSQPLRMRLDAVDVPDYLLVLVVVEPLRAPQVRHRQFLTTVVLGVGLQGVGNLALRSLGQLEQHLPCQPDGLHGLLLVDQTTLPDGGVALVLLALEQSTRLRPRPVDLDPHPVGRKGGRAVLQVCESQGNSDSMSHSHATHVTYATSNMY